MGGELEEGEEYDCVLIRSDRDSLYWESKDEINGYQILVENEYEEYIRESMFEGAVRVIAVQEEDDIALGEISFVPDIYVADSESGDSGPSYFDGTVECEIEYIDLETDRGRIIDSIRARCKKCGHETEALGTHGKSLNYSLHRMHEECPRGEENYYESE
jgi:hypothetical protein